MAFFTINEVREAAAVATGSIRELDVNLAARAETLFESRAAEARRSAITHFDIFLSHAYSDLVVVAGVYTLLTWSGFIVYVDWIHDRHRLNRNKVTPATAGILRERMRQCDALFYATTQNASMSRWMPWECGYFDGFDSKIIEDAVQPGHVAILPVVQTASSPFNGQEYLGLYPTAQKGSGPKRNINIHNQATPSKYVRFDQWIRNGHP